MAAFKTILKDLTGVLSARGAAMLAGDGEVVEMYSGEASIEMDLIGAHHAIVYNMASAATGRAVEGDVRLVYISSSSSRLAIIPLKDGYCLIVAMDKSGYMGKTLFESRRAARLIEEEMG
ncbi:MAG: roadblock/LC7 domain-containing protein [Deltaproteobacteria bacterium]|nr:roadblock/LC7 domain-containing protein [Deltaproteobacteria bacterium]